MEVRRRNIDYDPARKLKRSDVARLSGCEWISNGVNRCDSWRLERSWDVIVQLLQWRLKQRVEYVATTYGCPKCKDTEELQFIKDNGKPALIAGSYVS